MREFYCTYCGMPGNSMDHVVPHALAHGSSMPKSFARTLVVPACMACNRELGATAVVTVGDRAAWLRDRMTVKWRKILKTPDWLDEDFEELGPKMKARVRSQAKKKALCLSRLAWMDRVARQDPSICVVWREVDLVREFMDQTSQDSGQSENPPAVKSEASTVVGVIP